MRAAGRPPPPAAAGKRAKPVSAAEPPGLRPVCPAGRTGWEIDLAGAEGYNKAGKQRGCRLCGREKR